MMPLIFRFNQQQFINMSKTNINNDDFLKRLDIEVQDSQFLQKSLIQKETGVKKQYNFRDLHGLRLSKYWQPTDTIWTVINKRIIERVVYILDPDTYTTQNAHNLKEKIVQQKIKFMGFFIFLTLPFTFYYNFAKPRINRVKRLYLMQFYDKMGFFSKELGVKTKYVSPKDLQDSL